MEPAKRILAIDIMRGLTLFLMLFVNDLYAKGVPAWLTHRPVNYDGMGLADWVFPGFLFMVGMAVPFAINNRINKGHTTYKILYHIMIRTLSLLFIGVMMLNVSRLNPDLTGIKKNLWAILIYVCIFLIWNNYRSINKNLMLVIKIVGFTGLAWLLFRFKAGTPENHSWLITGWWGILGLIGWGYLVASIVYLFAKNSLLKVGFFWLLFVVLNILSDLNLLGFLNFAKPVFGVIISGNIPSIVLAGLFFGLMLYKPVFSDKRKFIIAGIIIGMAVLALGFLLRNWFIISKIKATPSWGMICNGISIVLFVILYLLIDVLEKRKWTVLFKPAGENSLTTYLAPDVLYYSIWLSGLPLFFYKQDEHAIIAVLGSLIWAALMVAFAALLSKIGIRLKL